MKHTNIRKQSRLLVEHILNNDPLSANDIFRSLINEAQLIREAEAAEEAGVAEEPAEPVETEETEETVETTEPVETEEETEEEIETEPISDEANSDEIDSMVDDVVEINCQINAKMISNLFDKIAELKNKLESIGLDKKSRDYIKFETTIEYYSNKLQDLQEKTNPGIDQGKVETAIQKIEDGLAELGKSAGIEDEESAIDDIASPDEIAADNGLADTEEEVEEIEVTDEGNAESDAEAEAASQGDAEETEAELEVKKSAEDEQEEKISDEEEIEELFS